MKLFIIAIALAALTGCGPDVATTAATSAQIKKREIEEGKKTMERAQEKVGQAAEQAQRRAEEEK